MDRKKQIEEMAKIIEKAKQKIWSGVRARGEDEDYLWHSRAIAEYLTEQGYRKFDKDSVVLSREEHEKLTKEHVTEQRVREIAQEYCEFVRKKTAEKILTELVKNFEYTFNKEGKPIIRLNADFCLNMCKKYGVEIKE